MTIFDMGGYGFYVWTSYGVTLLVLSLNLLFSFREKWRVKKKVAEYLYKNPF